MQRPITSRLRDNKNISKDPARQPVLHVGEVSPLKQTTSDAAGVNLRTTTTTPGTQKTTTGDYTTYNTQEFTGRRASTPEEKANWRKLHNFCLENPLSDRCRGMRKFEDDVAAAATEASRVEATVVEDVPGETVTTDQPLMTREKSTALSPYEQYQAKLKYNRAVRGEKGSERKQQRDIAKEYARRTDGNLYEKFKARRDVMTGKASYKDFQSKFGEDAENKFLQAEQNYNVYRGLAKFQQDRSMSAQQAVQQQNQSRARGQDIVGRERIATGTDVGDPYVTAQKDEFGGQVVLNQDGQPVVRTIDPNRTIRGTMAKMMDRHMNSVGVKQSSALKKGYFKGK